MKPTTQRLGIFFSVLLFIALTASAQSNRSFVSISGTQRTFVSAHAGNDANPCSVALPCRSFGAAIAMTLAGGEVIALDSGGYGVVTINQSISIISPAGVYAGITAFSGDAVLINTASLTVSLEGLTLNGLGGATGINEPIGGTLYVKRCLITGFSNAGISLNTPADPVFLFVDDTDIRNNGSWGIYALSANPFSVHNLVLDRSRVESNVGGVTIEVNGDLNAYACVFASNSGTAVRAVGSQTEANLDTCLISRNSIGVSATNGTARISNCTITNNTSKGINGPLNPAGHILSRQNNTVEGNSLDDTPGIYTAK